jgi:6,7-dimethyl-8-ribityllumazine synthase
MQLNVQLPVPVIFGILTVDNMEQAQERLGGKHGHKGDEAAITALKMIAMLRQLQK